MKSVADLPWENAPTSLSAEDIENPYPTIEDFFHFNTLPELKKSLHEWLIAGIEDQHKWKYKKLIKLIHGFSDLKTLMDALWVIHQKGTSFDNDEGSIRYGDETIGDWWSPRVRDRLRYGNFDESDFYTLQLSRAENLNPYTVIHDLFKKICLLELKQKLSWWFHTALTNPWEYNAMDKEEMAGLYQTVDKVVEAAFVINELHIFYKDLPGE